MPRSVTALVCACLLVAGAGCGQTEQEQAREVVQEYVDAQNSKDYETVCDLYADEFKEQLGIDENCVGFVEEQSSGAESQFEIVNVRVNDDRAMADLDVQGEAGATSRVGLVLENEDGDWKITALQ